MKYVKGEIGIIHGSIHQFSRSTGSIACIVTFCADMTIDAPAPIPKPNEKLAFQV